MSTNYTISQYDTKYDNITGSGWRYSPLIPGTSINGFIYANPTDVTFAAHIKNFIEPCAGAHYYAQGFFNSNYRSASMTVNLNEVEIYRASNKRNGYICLGFVSNGSLYRHSDIGLGCTEDYTVGNYKRGKWKAFVWGSSTTGGDVPWVWTYGQNYEFHYTDTVRIEMVITVNGNTHRADCNFYANNNQVANCYINTTAGQMFDVDSGGPKVRFVRFMSLVPI